MRILTKRVYNFYPGPATIQLKALKKANEQLLDYNGTGMSVMELSHRSKAYAEIHSTASSLVRELMNVPKKAKRE